MGPPVKRLRVSWSCLGGVVSNKLAPADVSSPQLCVTFRRRALLMVYRCEWFISHLISLTPRTRHRTSHTCIISTVLRSRGRVGGSRRDDVHDGHGQRGAPRPRAVVERLHVECVSRAEHCETKRQGREELAEIKRIVRVGIGAGRQHQQRAQRGAFRLAAGGARVSIPYLVFCGRGSTGASGIAAGAGGSATGGGWRRGDAWRGWEALAAAPSLVKRCGFGPDSGVNILALPTGHDAPPLPSSHHSGNAREVDTKPRDSGVQQLFRAGRWRRRLGRSGRQRPGFQLRSGSRGGGGL
eukprot:scaffold23232_cov131-Isochrysis_galbana.AAC.11